MVKIEKRTRQNRDPHARTSQMQEAGHAASAGTANECIEERLHETQVDTKDSRFRNA